MVCTNAVDSSEAMRWLLDLIGVWVVYTPFTLDDVPAAIVKAAEGDVEVSRTEVRI